MMWRYRFTKLRRRLPQVTDHQRLHLTIGCLLAVLAVTTAVNDRIAFGGPLIVLGVLGAGAGFDAGTTLLWDARRKDAAAQMTAVALAVWCVLRPAAYISAVNSHPEQFPDGWTASVVASRVSISMIWSAMLIVFLLARKKAR